MLKQVQPFPLGERLLRERRQQIGARVISRIVAPPQAPEQVLSYIRHSTARFGITPLPPVLPPSYLRTVLRWFLAPGRYEYPRAGRAHLFAEPLPPGGGSCPCAAAWRVSAFEVFWLTCPACG